MLCVLAQLALFNVNKCHVPAALLVVHDRSGRPGIVMRSSCDSPVLYVLRCFYPSYWPTVATCHKNDLKFPSCRNNCFLFILLHSIKRKRKVPFLDPHMHPFDLAAGGEA